MVLEPWESVSTVARHLGVAQDTVYRWIDKKRLPAHKLGGRWRFKLSEIDAWVTEQGGEKKLFHDLGEQSVKKTRSVQGNLDLVFRPFQYLGSKLRSLDPLLSTISKYAPASGHIVDLFSGSTIVAQALADSGYAVSAYDALRFSAEAAKATLGVGRTDGDDLLKDVERVIERASSSPLYKVFAPWIEEEERQLSRGDGAGLLHAGSVVPQIWRADNATSSLLSLFGDLDARRGSQPGVGFVCSTHYAGTYFGVKQAVAIDAIRFAIEDLGLSTWCRSSMLTALVSAMSAAAYTPGKHFAQPHKISGTKDLAFHKKRALSDRNVDVFKELRFATARLAARSYSPNGIHMAEQKLMEELLHRDVSGVDVIYADPPYTAQQYSRFYHVPEVLISGVVPDFMTGTNGALTSGLYHAERFKSRFCSKKGVELAFVDLMSLARKWQSALVISYAGNPNGKSGNDRMISMDNLVSLMKATGFQGITVEKISHNYKQVNNMTNSVSGRSDTEYLISARPAC